MTNPTADFILTAAGDGGHTIDAQSEEGQLFLENDWHNKGHVAAFELPNFEQSCTNWGLTYTVKE